MYRLLPVFAVLCTVFAAALGAESALAASDQLPDTAQGQPRDWQLGFQPSASPVRTESQWFHDAFLLPVITGICLFVLVLLLWVMVRYNRRANPTPATFTHNSFLEFVWTVIPVIILVVMSFFSLRLLNLVDTIPEADLTVKAVGYQWYWGYEYQDEEHGFDYIANMVPEEELAQDYFGNPQPRLLATDNDVVVPVGTVVRVLVTSDPTGVIHNFAVPALGLKMDAVPGRINETWFKAERVGMYYGQCSELCGARHAFMPISVRVVTQEQFDQWVAERKAEFAQANPAPRQLAAVSQQSSL